MGLLPSNTRKLLNTIARLENVTQSLLVKLLSTINWVEASVGREMILNLGILGYLTGLVG